MKLLHTADLHIGMTNYSKLDPETGLESRLLDFFNTFDFIIDTAIKESVDAFIFAGDAYKTRDPSPTQQRGFGERIKKIAKAGIPVILVVGNHDTPNAQGKANTLDIYSALEIDNVWVSRQCEFLNIPTKSGNLQVVTAPWLHKEEFKTLGDKLSLMYDKIKRDSPAILAGHLEVAGSSFGSEKGLALLSEVAIPLSLLTDKRLDYVALGHIHKHQNLNLSNNPPVVYSGSVERIDFSEEKESKGFVIVKINSSVTPTSSLVIPAKVIDSEALSLIAHGSTVAHHDLSEVEGQTRRAGIQKDSGSLIRSGMTKDVTFKFIPTPARKFVAIHVQLRSEDQNPTETILKEIIKYEVTDAVVRVTIDIPAEINSEIEMDKIKKALASAHYIAGISRNVERKDRIKIEGGSEVERLTPLEALQKYFESRKYSPEKMKGLEKYVTSLLEN